MYKKNMQVEPLEELDLGEKVLRWREVLSPIDLGTFALQALMIRKCEKRILIT